MQPTTTVHLIRHAKAGNRHRWTEPDHLRPLTKAGRRQARALCALLEAQPFSRLLSSPYIRCVQTLEPLAEARALPIEPVDELSEGATTGDAVQLVLSIAADGPAALSTHGDVMMHVVEALLAAGVPLDGTLEFKKGATWILEVRDGTFASGRYLPPPASDRVR
jgi:8-oxo-dGTP diphosphatase